MQTCRCWSEGRCVSLRPPLSQLFLHVPFPGVISPRARFPGWPGPPSLQGVAPVVRGCVSREPRRGGHQPSRDPEGGICTQSPSELDGHCFVHAGSLPRRPGSRVPQPVERDRGLPYLGAVDTQLATTCTTYRGDDTPRLAVRLNWATSEGSLRSSVGYRRVASSPFCPAALQPVGDLFASVLAPSPPTRAPVRHRGHREIPAWGRFRSDDFLPRTVSA